MAALRPDPARRLMRPVIGAILILLALAAGALLGPVLSTPGDTSPEAGFARDMATHHGQAVDMSFLARDASTDAEIRTIAADIIVTQSTQRGVFMGWLQQWGLSQSSAGPRMAWMPGHTHLASDTPVLMHGMATAEEIQRLASARGQEADVLFLQLMIRHHEGGVIMARAIEDLSRRREIVAMAKSIEETQLVEITQMKALLATRHAQPFASLIE